MKVSFPNLYPALLRKVCWSHNNKLLNCLPTEELFAKRVSQCGAWAKILGTKEQRLSYQTFSPSLSPPLSPTHPPQPSLIYIIIKQIPKDAGFKGVPSSEPVRAPNCLHPAQVRQSHQEDASHRSITRRVHVKGLVFQCPLGQDRGVSSCLVVSLPQASADNNGSHTSQIFKNSLVLSILSILFR